MNINQIQAKNIITKSPVHHGFSANPYVGCYHNCMYCYAEYMRNWTGHDYERWGQFVDVKNWIPLTDKQKKNLKGQSIFISSATDPYQPVEMEYGRTRALLNELVGSGAKITVVTKSHTVVRDWDVLKELNATVALSINTLDENFRRDMDYSSTIEEKILALDILHKHGIYTVCFISPIFPGITDAPSIIEKTKDYCHEVWLEQLVLNYPYKNPVLYYIKTKYPSLYQYYDELYNKENNEGWDKYDEYMGDWCKENGYMYSHSSHKNWSGEKPLIINQRGHKEFKAKYLEEKNASKKS